MEIKLEETKELKPVTITFTPEEFEMLKSVAGVVGGNFDHPLRIMVEEIWDFGESNGYTKATEDSSIPFVLAWNMWVP